MINTIADLRTIQYEPTEVDPVLLKSIQERGIAIPVRVRRTESGYECVDGRKRLSACAELAVREERFLQIPIMILNDFSKSGSSFWGNTQNKH